MDHADLSGAVEQDADMRMTWGTIGREGRGAVARYHGGGKETATAMTKVESSLRADH